MPITTRWADNDVFAHVNNVTYYAYFDTAVNQYLIEQGGFDIARSPAVGVVVETMCRFFRSVAFPDRLRGRPARRQARALLGPLRDRRLQGRHGRNRGPGHFVHVYVKRETTDVVPVPDGVERAVARLVVNPGPGV